MSTTLYKNVEREGRGIEMQQRRSAGGILSKNLIMYHDPKSPAAEAFRAMRTNVGFANIDDDIKTIAITSPEPSDGKSTTACNFAISLAQIDKKVLLLECDLRKPKIHRNFGIGNDVGLTHILADMIFDEQPVMHYIKMIPEIPNLSVLTAGYVTPNPAEMLSSIKFKNFLDQLKEEYDTIIIDTPPVAQLTDAAIISKVADGVLLVIASGDPYSDGNQCKAITFKYTANILGVVLTRLINDPVDLLLLNYDRYYEE